MVFILAILRGVKDTDLASIFALSAIAGGAIGNFVDRIRFGYVVDFLDFYIPQGFFAFSALNSSWPDYPLARNLHWPAFNVADMAIVCGALALLLIEFKRYYEEQKKIILTGDPVAWQKGTRVSGKRIIMFLEEDRSVVEGDSQVVIEGEGGGKR